MAKHPSQVYRGLLKFCQKFLESKADIYEFNSLYLRRTTFPLSTETTFRAVDATQMCQLWASSCSALCGCVNNPQNEEGQRICVAAFPVVKTWLQQIDLSRTEIFQSVCSFIAMTVANNFYAQESFSASGGLDNLCFALVQLASAADTSLLSCQLSVTLSKTLSACITDNPSLASGLAPYGVVSQLFFLLASPHLNPEERLSVLLTLGLCTVASEEHQSQLVQCGGLPLIITLLTEDTSEEVRKAATFILQTCKQATMSLEVPGSIKKLGKGENVEPVTNMEGFRSSAREFLHRIDLLEKRQAKDVQEDIDTSAVIKELEEPTTPPAVLVPLQPRKSIKTVSAAHRQTGTLTHLEARGENDIERHSMRSMQKEKAENNQGDVLCHACKGTREPIMSHEWSPEGGRAHQTADNKMFKLPATVKHSVPKETMREKYCEEELQDHRMSTVREMSMKRDSPSQIRCAGCVLPFEEVTSHTFSSLQNSCKHSCDMHKVLQEASERFRASHFLCKREHRDNSMNQAHQDSARLSAAAAAEPRRSRKNWSEVCLTPIHRATGKGKSFLSDNNWKKHNGITLTPLHRGATKETSTSHNRTGPGLNPLRRSRPAEDTERREEKSSGLRTLGDEMESHTDLNSSRRKRRDFSHSEVHYLLSGVETLGFSWNSILWSYPFQPGRTNVDLAKKYRQLMKAREANVDRA
ncbi:telomere repeats-binding bouquet formation protein 1 isoform X1 [Xyrichtys novacula]|uniref:Telomere repeats-binding bouquet formation protein 1 isoform X1 n=1 Tax=Xyrichtys novacula TaxID=13765 RepID=A0AAV1F6G5_XYRNO|nr:telomere repeats-binding bouquet formation protein 1 isoform X1 [Xyrichtys novacula]